LVYAAYPKGSERGDVGISDTQDRAYFRRGSLANSGISLAQEGKQDIGANVAELIRFFSVKSADHEEVAA
jgi:hypothetical protein